MSQSQDLVTCPQCSQSNRLGQKFCRHCGRSLADATVTHHVAETSPSAVATHRLAGKPPLRVPGGSSSGEPHEIVTRRLAPPGFDVLPVGAIVRQCYEVRQTFDAQAQANTYLVTDAQTQEQCLLYESANPDQFNREGQYLSHHLSHPALVTIKDVFAETPYGDQARGYLVTEYPLAVITSIEPPSEIDVLQWGEQLADALAYLHDNGLVHGNIQPASLAMSNNQVKLGNFSSVTAAKADTRTQDIYQLALTLYHLAAPNDHAPTFSPALTQIFQREFSQDPKQLYSDARAFAADLQKATDALRHPKSFTTVVGRLSDVGLKRELDEDSLLTIEAIQFTHVGSQVLGLYAVADGMGGASAGEVASKMVTETMAREVIGKILAPRFSTTASSQIDYGALLKASVEQANSAVFKARQGAKSDMGSTVVAALLVGNEAFIVNVGDSRAYLLSRDQIKKITKDHSLVQALVDQKQITEDEIRTHPQRNFILRNVGDKPQIQVDLFSQTLEPGQYLLLCCDGLWEMVLEQDVYRIVTSSPSPQAACRALIDAANANGGDDNITCVLIRFESAQGGAK